MRNPARSETSDDPFYRPECVCVSTSMGVSSFQSEGWIKGGMG